jgi:propionyl-CoA carboxylase alpha chain
MIVLVANRGEIARRVFATCRAMGIGTVAVYSDPDAGSPHVREADAAVRLPGAAAVDTYLRAELLVAAAQAAGATAVHPGYGFLSENADFARAVEKAGLCWIGPPAAAIEAMGAKVGAKALMRAAGVPVLAELPPGSVTAADLPVLVKASAGGGGRGMRIVRSLPDLAAALESARAEAAAAFGDPAVFCEPYVEGGRHIEVQVLADQHGTVWALGERECSIQRRYQKVLEEAPSPAVTPDLRERLSAAAVAAARAVSYVGAGTVEFMLTGPGDFFFLEMNTRLQVEHPVTEAVHGLDLVRHQLLIAGGAALPAAPPEPSGHAIEVRLYAEDPAEGWRPSTGPLHRFHVPDAVTEFTPHPGVRVDAGVTSGSLITPYYDPMLAKVIAHAPSRAEAARVLAAALAGARLHGPVTNRDLLVRVLRHGEFLAGDTDTGFLGRHDLATPLADPAAERLSALAAALADAAAARAAARVQPGVPAGWRNVPSQPELRTYQGPAGTHEVTYRIGRGVLDAPGHPGVLLIRAAPDEVVLAAGGVRRAFAVARYPGLVCVDSALGPVALTPIPRFPDAVRAADPGSLLAPMPGTVASVAVSVGDQVSAGQHLLVLEAMKMQHPVLAPTTGTVQQLPVTPGTQVDAGALLAVIHSDQPPESGE